MYRLDLSNEVTYVWVIVHVLQQAVMACQMSISELIFVYIKFQALIEVITSSDRYVSVRATILLGELLHKVPL